MKARAPGKVVLSGAYSVLHGAPAVVSAVSRYVVADTSRPAEFLSEEVQAALDAGQVAPWFDASDLREAGRKLGLGSSAAILAASLYALSLAAGAVDDPSLRKQLFARGLSAHRAAQGGGSGVDVAASTFGGTLVYRLTDTTPEVTPVALPADLCIEVWTCPTSASTRELLAAVARLGERAPNEHQKWLGAQGSAAEAAAKSLLDQDAGRFIQALAAQFGALSGLGRAAGVPIVTPELSQAFPLAAAQGGVLLPAGAGGGDIALFVGDAPSSPALRASLEMASHRLLAVELGAPGVRQTCET